MNQSELYGQLHSQYLRDGRSYLQRRAIPNELVDYLEKYCTSTSKVLELGCGAGHLAAKLQDRGLDILASDISQVALDLAKSYYPSLNLKLIDAQNIPYKDGSFSAVVSAELVEHLPQVHQHFNEVWRILDTGGFYCFTMPNKWLDIIYSRLQPSKVKKDTHVSLMSINTLKQTLFERGFSCTFLRQRELSESQKEKLGDLLPEIFAKLFFKLFRILSALKLTFIQPTIMCVARKNT